MPDNIEVERVACGSDMLFGVSHWLDRKVGEFYLYILTPYRFYCSKLPNKKRLVEAVRDAMEIDTSAGYDRRLGHFLLISCEWRNVVCVEHYAGVTKIICQGPEDEQAFDFEDPPELGMFNELKQRLAPQTASATRKVPVLETAALPGLITIGTVVFTIVLLGLCRVSILIILLIVFFELLAGGGVLLCTVLARRSITYFDAVPPQVVQPSVAPPPPR